MDMIQANLKMREFLAKWQPDRCPLDDTYDDTEGAEAHGGDVTAWEMCQELRQIFGFDLAPEPAPDEDARLDADLQCPACGRDYKGDDTLHPGALCPAIGDGCPPGTDDT